MRSVRIKLFGQSAVYHCISRVVGGEKLLDGRCKEVLRKQLLQVADFCGVKVMTYCLMSNHFHILVRVPASPRVTDGELVRRVTVLYGDHDPRIPALLAVLRLGGEEAEWARHQLYRRMGDVSMFMKELKQRFSIWYNRNHGRFGTLWAERFKSLLVEDESLAMQRVAAYIDLNPVRAGLCDDPARYRYSGYAEAMKGDVRARRGLERLVQEDRWEEAGRAYRIILFGEEAGGRSAEVMVSQGGQARLLPAESGKLPIAEMLRYRNRYFSDGVVLGSHGFVAALIEDYRDRVDRKRRWEPCPIEGAGDGGRFTTMRRLRGSAFG